MPALPTWPPIRLLIYVLFGLSIVLSATLIGQFLAPTWRSGDWVNLADAGRLAGRPELYGELAEGGPFRWSPLAAWLLVPLEAIGPLAWALLHLVGLAAFVDRRVVLLGLASYPFWWDAFSGNVLTFVALTAWWALRGSPIGISGFLVLSVLMPRPLMLPIALWILWQRPKWRAPFAAMVALHALAVGATGLGDDWLRVIASSGGEIEHQWNIGPSRFIGLAWLPLGALLAAWLMSKKKLGLASLAVSPYLFPYYLMLALVDLRAPIALRLPSAHLREVAGRASPAWTR